jgi:hypothetical protein
VNARTETLAVGDHTFRLRWDFTAIATLEQITGLNALDGIPVTARNVLALLWSAIDADAAARGVEPPVSFRQFGSFLCDEESQSRAMAVAVKLLQSNDTPSRARSRTPRRAAK